MISTDLKTNLENTIQEFYEWAQKINFYTSKHTITELRGIFLNKLKANLKGTNEAYNTGGTYSRSGLHIIGTDNVFFELIEGRIKNLKFVVTNEHNLMHKNMVQGLIDALKQIDILTIEKRSNIQSGVKDKLNNIINQINNFKIKEYV